MSRYEMGPFLCAALVLGWCVWRIVASRRPCARPAGPLCVAAVLGSGGHTTEMLSILRALPRDMYTPRIYVWRTAYGTWASRRGVGRARPGRMSS